MNKRLLIISPNFPPVNGADMQRIRMSLPYFRNNGWDVEVVAIKEQFSSIVLDPLLLNNIPKGIKVHKINVIDRKLTSIFGLGSLGLRSLWHYRRKVNELLQTEHFDLIYFSTTQFPVLILGAYWKRKFGVPFVIDMQDPWHSDYYKAKPRSQQPKKYWFSYRMNKYLEPFGVAEADGVISVSRDYIDTLRNRYPRLADIPSATITFGGFEEDFEVARRYSSSFKNLLDTRFKNVVYVGRGGVDMHRSIEVVFHVLQLLIAEDEQWVTKLRFYFIGTSYAPTGEGVQTIQPLAAKYGLTKYVIEITDRISYYHTLATLQNADGLLIAGSDDPSYTASKIFPYILTKKPLLAIFNPSSPALRLMKEFGLRYLFNHTNANTNSIKDFLKSIANGLMHDEDYHQSAIEKYSAREMALEQCILFNKVLHGKIHKNS